jgi:hypothetical protein
LPLLSSLERPTLKGIREPQSDLQENLYHPQH